MPGDNGAGTERQLKAERKAVAEPATTLEILATRMWFGTGTIPHVK